MKLITTRTTLAEFSGTSVVLIKDPETGVIHQMRIAVLHDGEYYAHGVQGVFDGGMPRYVRHPDPATNSSVIITSKLSLLQAIQSNTFYIS